MMIKTMLVGAGLLLCSLAAKPAAAESADGRLASRWVSYALIVEDSQGRVVDTLRHRGLASAPALIDSVRISSYSGPLERGPDGQERVSARQTVSRAGSQVAIDSLAEDGLSARVWIQAWASDPVGLTPGPSGSSAVSAFQAAFPALLSAGRPVKLGSTRDRVYYLALERQGF